jgi:ATP-dependent RNA helicase RhlB
LIRRIFKGIRERILGTGPSNQEKTLEDTKAGEQPNAEVSKTSHKPKQQQQPSKRQISDKKPSLPSSKAASGQAPQRSPKPRWDISQFKVPPAEGKTRFHDLNLPIGVMHAIADLGFEYCTPVQAEVLPKALTGLDATGRAQTGTGKTAAFLVTILTHLQRKQINEQRKSGTPRALILVPTRELALQVKKDAVNLGKYSRRSIVAIFGGMDYQKQKQFLTEKVVDIVVATPGRLLDFKRQGDIDLSKVEILVVDEADQMLDMGFIPDVRQIIQSTPPKGNRQTMLFGATLTPEVIKLASQWTRDPFVVDIEPEQVAVDTVDQVVYLVTAQQRYSLLYNLITQQNLKRVMVFCNRRDQTRKLTDRLRANGINCAMLSGEVAQAKRIQTLEDFRSGKIRVLVATDVAGRGIHVEDVSHVVNYNLPVDPEDYVHRIGRTGRAGASGISISFATEDESFYLPAIEEFIGEKFKCIYPEDRMLIPPPKPSYPKPDENSPQPSPRPQRPRRRPYYRPKNPPSESA